MNKLFPATKELKDLSSLIDGNRDQNCQTQKQTDFLRKQFWRNFPYAPPKQH